MKIRVRITGEVDDNGETRYGVKVKFEEKHYERMGGAAYQRFILRGEEWEIEIPEEEE